MQSHEANAVPDARTAATRTVRADFEAWEASLRPSGFRRGVNLLLRLGYDALIAYGAMAVPQSLAFRRPDL